MRPGLVLSLAIFLFGITVGIWLGGAPTLLAQSNAPGGSTDVEAAMGTAFTYQGRLHQNGQPANGSFEMRFTLFDA